MSNLNQPARMTVGTVMSGAGTGVTYAAGGNQIVGYLGLTLAEWSFAATTACAVVTIAYTGWKWWNDCADRRARRSRRE